jgi:hypothetical protein
MQLRAAALFAHDCSSALSSGAISSTSPNIKAHVTCVCLQVLWLHYLERFRNLQFLEAQLEGYRKAEQAEADAAERRRRKMQRKLA